MSVAAEADVKVKANSKEPCGIDSALVKQPWFNDVCEETLNQREDARNQWFSDQYNREKKIIYKKCQKKATRILKQEKQKYNKKLMEEGKAGSEQKDDDIISSIQYSIHEISEISSQPTFNQNIEPYDHVSPDFLNESMRTKPTGSESNFYNTVNKGEVAVDILLFSMIEHRQEHDNLIKGRNDIESEVIEKRSPIIANEEIKSWDSSVSTESCSFSLCDSTESCKSNSYASAELCKSSLCASAELGEYNSSVSTESCSSSLCDSTESCKSNSYASAESCTSNSCASAELGKSKTPATIGSKNSPQRYSPSLLNEDILGMLKEVNNSVIQIKEFLMNNTNNSSLHLLNDNFLRIMNKMNNDFIELVEFLMNNTNNSSLRNNCDSDKSNQINVHQNRPIDLTKRRNDIESEVIQTRSPMTNDKNIRLCDSCVSTGSCKPKTPKPIGSRKPPQRCPPSVHQHKPIDLTKRRNDIESEVIQTRSPMTDNKNIRLCDSCVSAGSCKPKTPKPIGSRKPPQRCPPSLLNDNVLEILDKLDIGFMELTEFFKNTTKNSSLHLLNDNVLGIMNKMNNEFIELVEFLMNNTNNSSLSNNCDSYKMNQFNGMSTSEDITDK
ncbi:Hypothetical protein CINCED_3A000632 [Cinara cedri]|uniref:Uncharacterized protein n=1 Tax=Cinara cedri TaxID=506608 RepID=A0A5E4MGP3_9HEMI|nr:Hypothetical protein CINCED_3A000632 [Cinara cedri]